MKGWRSHAKAGVLDWLLEEDDPTVRYLALRDLLDRKEGDDKLEEARAGIMKVGRVPRILDKQCPEGHWGAPEDFYVRSKYKGTVWNLIALAELCADPADGRIKAACEFVLRWSQDRSSGGFSYQGTGERGGRRSGVIPCLTGNMTFSLIRLGYLEDERVRHGLDWLSRYMRFSLEPLPLKEFPYVHDRCWRDHTCRSGAVKALKALAEVPVDRRDPGLRRVVDEGTEYLLTQNIIHTGPGHKGISRPEWRNLGFPLMWNTDLLEILGILAKLGVRDERMDEAIGLVLSKQGANGRWRQENRFVGRLLTSFERDGQESKWVTLNALRTLKALP